MGFHLLYLEDRKGIFVEGVAPRGSAEKAGLKIGDRIVEVCSNNVEATKPSEVIQVGYQSDSVSAISDWFFRVSF